MIPSARIKGEGVAGRDVASVFSTAVFASLGADDEPSIRKRLAPILALVEDRPTATLADAFKEAHSLLRRQYRSEYFYKNQVISKLVFGRHRPTTASAILELPAGRSIADLVVLNGTSTVFEVKTDLDSLARLEVQVRDYLTCFEHVNVVTSPQRAAQVAAMVPDVVGVVAVAADGALRSVRASRGGLERLERRALFQLLRQDEAVSLLHGVSGYTADVASGDLWARTRDLFLLLPIEVAHRGVVAQLRARGQRTGEVASAPDFPHELRALAYSKRLSRSSTQTLVRRLNSCATLTGATPRP